MASTLIRWALTLTALLFAAVPAEAQSTKELNLFFYGAKPKPTRKQIARLDSLLGTIPPSQITSIKLVGHTDSLFGRASNVVLAEKRALSVRDLLLKRNVPDSLITIVPFNAPVAVVEGNIPTGRSRNRRVYVRIDCGPPGAGR